MSATEDLLGTLHEAVAKTLLDKVLSGEATPAELSTVVKFLKDNGIEAIPTPDSSLDRLSREFPEFDKEGTLHGAH